MSPATYIEVDTGFETSCWIWQGSMGGRGRKYGRIAFVRNGKWSDRGAHIHYYEKMYGPVPDGLELDHLCNVTACVNPDHLEPVTHAENVRRAFAIKPKPTHCVHGHFYDVENTYIAPDGSMACRVCRHDAVNRYKNRKRMIGGEYESG